MNKTKQKYLAGIVTLIMVFSFLPLSVYANDQAAEINFSDKGNISPWAWESVEKAIDLGLIGGDDKGRMNPKKNITRAEFIKLLLVVMGEEPSTDFQGLFIDVPKGAWYTPVIEKAATLGLVNGDETGKFLPGQTISRQDMAVILTKAFLMNDVTDQEPNVSDADEISPYAVSSVTTVINKGYMSGIGNDAFGPKGKATREMAIAIMIRIIGKL